MFLQQGVLATVPHMSTKKALPNSRDADQQLLSIYIGYRILLAGLLLFLQQLNISHPILGQFNPQSFHQLATFYMGVTLLSVALNQDRLASRTVRSLIIVLTDIIILTLFIQSSGGVASNLPILLVVTTAAGNLLLRGRLGLMISALATLGLLYQQLHLILDHGISWQALNSTALLGLGFFAIALILQSISARIRESETLATHQQQRIQHMHQLSLGIIEHMHTGMIVLDHNLSTLLANASAQRLLHQDVALSPGTPLAELSRQLDQDLKNWLKDPNFRSGPFQNQPDAPLIRASYSKLPNPSDHENIYLIFIEDQGRLIQQAQQLKLASLGRFTAGMAHELRNPLATINHASQLLAESSLIEDTDLRLVQMITRQAQRMNRMIENILQLSRRQASSAERFELISWLEDFFREYIRQDPQPVDLEQQHVQSALWIRFDREQLYQVVYNLTQNGLRYSRRLGNNRFSLSTGVIEHGRPFLMLTDHGPGVSPEQQKHLFEPFHTTEPQGTGLGLYLARELCQSNQARLDWIAQTPGCTFRITFAHPDRIEVRGP